MVSLVLLYGDLVGPVGPSGAAAHADDNAGASAVLVVHNMAVADPVGNVGVAEASSDNHKEPRSSDPKAGKSSTADRKSDNIFTMISYLFLLERGRSLR